eukprot:TRINITY_DN38318_c0_g1_i1.p1 TRINITY_DN38318_c0_g1~~TRINITY_DN38318_c0_g1_i1.p1  ORF type:complete len:302 (-),score=13.68 TRINITY_DN38318_c0_g1_i1:298-1203(-)
MATWSRNTRSLLATAYLGISSFQGARREQQLSVQETTTCEEYKFTRALPSQHPGDEGCVTIWFNDYEKAVVYTREFHLEGLPITFGSVATLRRDRDTQDTPICRGQGDEVPKKARYGRFRKCACAEEDSAGWESCSINGEKGCCTANNAESSYNFGYYSHGECRDLKYAYTLRTTSWFGFNHCEPLMGRWEPNKWKGPVSFQLSERNSSSWRNNTGWRAYNLASTLHSKDTSQICYREYYEDMEVVLWHGWFCHTVSGEKAACNETKTRAYLQSLFWMPTTYSCKIADRHACCTHPRHTLR